MNHLNNEGPNAFNALTFSPNANPFKELKSSLLENLN